jgi:hypothetical protein
VEEPAARVLAEDAVVAVGAVRALQSALEAGDGDGPVLDTRELEARVLRV